MTTHHILKLKTGETLCVAEMPHMESVSLGVWAGVATHCWRNHASMMV